jgi:hypothetical protein
MEEHIEKVKQELEKVGVRLLPRENLHEHRNHYCKTFSLRFAKKDGKLTKEKEGYFGFIVIDPPEREGYQVEIMVVAPRLWQAKYNKTDIGELFGKWDDYPVWHTQSLVDLKAKFKDFVFYSNNPMGKKSTYVHPDTAQNLEAVAPLPFLDYFNTGFYGGHYHFIKSRGRVTIVPRLSDPGRAWLSKQFGVDKDHIKFQSYPEFKKNGGKMKKKRTNMFFNRKNRD